MFPEKELPMCPTPSNTRQRARRRFTSSSPFATPFALPVHPILDTLSLSPDADVLELGAVACRFTLPIARYMDTKRGAGIVHACDFDEEEVNRTFQKAKDAHLMHMVSPIFWDPDKSAPIPIADEGADGVIAINSSIFHQTPIRFTSECLRILRPGGRLFVGEWRDAREPLERIVSHPESATQAWDILKRTRNTVCVPLDIPEMVWAVMLTKSHAPVL